MTTDGLLCLPLRITPPNVNSDAGVLSVSQMEVLPVTVHQLQAASASDKMLSKVFCYTKGSWPYQVLANLHLFFTLEMS